MYVNEIVFYIWLVVTLSVLSGLVAWLVVKICKFVRDAGNDIKVLKNNFKYLEERFYMDLKEVWKSLHTLEDKQRGTEGDEKHETN